MAYKSRIIRSSSNRFERQLKNLESSKEYRRGYVVSRKEPTDPTQAGYVLLEVSLVSNRLEDSFLDSSIEALGVENTIISTSYTVIAKRNETADIGDIVEIEIRDDERVLELGADGVFVEILLKSPGPQFNAANKDKKSSNASEAFGDEKNNLSQTDSTPVEDQEKEPLDISEQLSPNFTLKRMTSNSSKIDNQPTSQRHIDSLKALCNNILEPLQEALGKRLSINSAYRSQKLNEKIGGSSTSQHVLGEAVDIECSGISNWDLAQKIIELNLPFDQLILEFHKQNIPSSGWVHVSHKLNGSQRGQKISAVYKNDQGRTIYESGLKYARE